MIFSRSIARLATLSLMAVVGATVVPQLVPVAPANAQSAPATTTTLERAAFNRINTYRAQRGLPALVWNETIANQARIHSQNMAAGRVPFGHNGFAARISATRIPYSSAAENVAWNMGYADPAQQAAQGWFKSPGHEQNIRGNFNQSAIGVARNAKGQVYFTQLFIKTR
jgi:uncharacterized protein YkwD